MRRQSTVTRQRLIVGPQPICRALDGKVFKHGQGPYPPQHFNCRSRYINIPIGLEKEFEEAAREDYGEWLNDQSEAERRKVLALGVLQCGMDWSESIGPSDAIRKFVARDGSELTLDQLRSRGYGSSAR